VTNKGIETASSREKQRRHNAFSKSFKKFSPDREIQEAS